MSGGTSGRLTSLHTPPATGSEISLPQQPSVVDVLWSYSNTSASAGRSRLPARDQNEKHLPWDAWRGRVRVSQEEMERLYSRETKTWSRIFYQGEPCASALNRLPPNSFRPASVHFKQRSPPHPGPPHPTIAVHFSFPTHGDVTVMGYPGERLLDAAKRSGLGMNVACGGRWSVRRVRYSLMTQKGIFHRSPKTNSTPWIPTRTRKRPIGQGWRVRFGWRIICRN
ncbi:hypothetical protein M427DRAFT_333747 [Gonapodya prolifera JEL478]|uniref:Uncharacterized protein n=1 Tax=Gonapodya prolifera (strain JEL478) TaxID=1344416 RepID=A0A139AF18_GONPJ|nr:hypothetical protein M427DRAFT_333747 [Gonapodya prolifera JEL478]|eukprot:KXS15025.1 hypothetical protein M427DRAFT_333747 [Gonapodya prolifera JEL478]